MAAHSYLRVGDVWLFACRESWRPEIAATFRDEELATDLAAPVYTLEAMRLRQRLDVLGLTSGVAQRRLARAYAEARAYDQDAEPLDDWLRLAEEALGSAGGDPGEPPRWADWDSDPRLLLRLILDVAPPDTEVAYDISEVVSRGHAVASPDLCSLAFQLLHSDSVLAPLIVLTEGTTDAEVLGLAMQVLAPHLKDYVRFLDYDFKPEGGTSALLRAVRAFAAAGVTNPVLAVFDNDSAAADTLRLLKDTVLPANFRVIQLPYLPLAAAYPTLGPSGPSTMDVNGLAASLELFFGEDVLRPDGTDLEPVQWTGYIAGVRRYQGEVMNKKSLQSAFRAKASRALQRGHTSSSEDWSAMALVIEAVIAPFDI